MSCLVMEECGHGESYGLKLSVKLFKGQFLGFSTFCSTLSMIFYTLSGVSILYTGGVDYVQFIL